MKAPSAGYRIVASGAGHRVDRWQVLDTRDGDRVVWQGRTYPGARNAHYRLSIARITGKPVSAEQARRAGNA